MSSATKKKLAGRMDYGCEGPGINDGGEKGTLRGLYTRSKAFSLTSARTEKDERQSLCPRGGLGGPV